jgi:hypothetical protein
MEICKLRMRALTLAIAVRIGAVSSPCLFHGSTRLSQPFVASLFLNMSIWLVLDAMNI